MRKNYNKRNLPRLIIQWSIIGYLLFLGIKTFVKQDYLADFEAYCPFGGLQSLGSYLLSDSLACSMTSTQIAMGIMLVIGIFLFSKLFCAYICPIGTISEWLGTIGDKYKFRIPIKGLTDKILRSLKYILLFLTFYFTIESNELFCKKFDPFYAVASGFSSDVVWLYAFITIAIVLAGSILFRLFWCKYLCPLGAISNLIKFSWFFAGILLIYIVVLKAGVQLSYVWPLAFTAIGGYLLEIGGERLNFTAVTKITRNESSCTNCNLCSRRCPQLIDVAKMKVVNHVDCNLCGDCLEVCPEKDTLQINKKSGIKWLPPTAVAVLFALGLILSANWEVPTIDQRWGTAEEMQKSAVFTQSGITSIKCYGSSMAFAAKMKEVQGVFGVTTFVSSHTVKIYYDPSKITSQKLQEEIFIPQKTSIRNVSDGIQNIKAVIFQVENFFDPSDFKNLSLLLKEKTDALGMESSFSCPVTVKIYLPENSVLDESSLKEILETKKLITTTESTTITLELSFKITGQPKMQNIPLKDYKYHMFESYEDTFNWKPNFQPGILDTLVVPVVSNLYDPDAIPYFVSHISNDNGVVGFKSTMDSTNRIYFHIIYVDSLTNKENITKSMKSDSLTVTFEGGEVEKMINSFKF